MNIPAFLKSLTLFASLSDDLIAGIGTLAVTSTHPAGSVIFNEQEPASAVFAVLEGEVTIVKRLGQGQEKTLAILGAGGVFGETAFVSTAPRTATAVTRTGASLVSLPHNAFRGWIRSHPDAGVAVLSGMMAIILARMERTSRELATVYETGKIISTAASLPALAQGILDQILLAVPEIDRGTVYVYNPFNDEYDPAASVGAQSGLAPLPPRDPLARRVRDAMPSCVIDTQGPDGAHLAAPVMKGADFLGFITVRTNRGGAAFDHNHAILLAAVCGAFAEAIENIRHRQEERDRDRLSRRNI